MHNRIAAGELVPVLRYHDTCLPDYFQGAAGAQMAVSLGFKISALQVLQGLLTALKDMDYVEIESTLPSDVEAILKARPLTPEEWDSLFDEAAEQARAMFDKHTVHDRWSTVVDDLEESYAYFSLRLERDK